MSARKTEFQQIYWPGWDREPMLVRLVDVIASLPADKPWVLEVSRHVKARSGEANNYLWGVCYTVMSEASGYEKAELHDELCKAFFGEVTVTICGRARTVPIRTTTTNEVGEREVLPVAQFADFIDFVIRQAAQYYDVVIPPPTEKEVPRG